MMEKFPEVLVFKNNIFQDDRGFFLESWKKDSNLPDFKQENISYSIKNTLRGLHMQTGFESQAKFIQVIRGLIFDVVVDANILSPTYGQWAGIELDINHSIFIPNGFLHGFLALEDSYLSYKNTNYYNKASEKTVIYDDLDINIDWPITYRNRLIMSEKDKKGIKFKDL